MLKVEPLPRCSPRLCIMVSISPVGLARSMPNASREASAAAFLAAFRSLRESFLRGLFHRSAAERT